ncbi:MAG: ParB/RepB/Spo0J family partition protein [Ruminococcaceae bacterium]|nr:ParB/RepB/Spo0J family partition protein [Oscillospiraceae bacterium]
MAGIGINIGKNMLDDLFKTDEGRKTEEIKPIKLEELKPFTEQPFKVIEDESMDELVESIKQSGVLSPIVTRPHPDGGYEILSGHRRARACELAGITEVPAVVKNLDDDTAIILLVDSNLQREHILPSEKAKAYQMKLEAMKRQGQRTDLTSAQFGQKSDHKLSKEILAEQVGESRNQIQRYIRLTNLIDPLLDMVDKNGIAMNAAVELSYLGSKAQSEVLEAIESEDAAPSIEQAKKIRRFNDEGRLNPDVILSIMQEQKPEKLKITLGDEQIKKYFPKSFTKKQMEDTIIKLLENWHRKREQNMER